MNLICTNCGAGIVVSEYDRDTYVNNCPTCNHHIPWQIMYLDLIVLTHTERYDPDLISVINSERQAKINHLVELGAIRLE